MGQQPGEWWDEGGDSGCPKAVCAGPVGIALSGRRNSREGEGVPVFSYLAPFPLPLVPCLRETNSQQAFSLEYPLYLLSMY